MATRPPPPSDPPAGATAVSSGTVEITVDIARLLDMRARGLITVDEIGLVLRAMDFCMGRGEAVRPTKPVLRVIRGGRAG